MDFIFVCLGYYNKNTKWWLINNRSLYPTILEAEKSKIKALADSVSGEPTSWFIQMGAFLLCPHKMKELRDFLRISFIRVLIPFMKAPYSLPNHLPKTSPLDTTTLGIRFQHKIGEGEVGGTQKHSLHGRLYQIKNLLCERDC